MNRALGTLAALLLAASPFAAGCGGDSAADDDATDVPPQDGADVPEEDGSTVPAAWNQVAS